MQAFRSSGEAGFTLVEVLVALAIFSIGVMALFHLRGESARSVTGLQARALAQIVAENRIIEALEFGAPLSIGVRDGELEMAARQWRWSEEISEAPDAAILHVRVLVRAEDDDDILAEMTAFHEAN